MSPDYSLTIIRRQSLRVLAVTDLDFAKDLAMLSTSIQDAQSLSIDVEVAVEKVRLFINRKRLQNEVRDSHH